MLDSALRVVRGDFRLISLITLIVAYAGYPLLGLAQSLLTNRTFSAGNLAVVRVGDGSTTLSTSSAAVSLVQYAASGTSQSPISTIALPTAVSGDNRRLTLGGTAETEGSLSLSSNSRFLSLAGYDAAAGESSVSSSSTSLFLRTIGRIGSSGEINTSTTTTSFSGSNVRSAVTTNGFDYWTGGANSPGVGYSTLGSSGSQTQLVSSAPNARVVTLSGNQLYVNTSSVISKVGNGTPTITSQTLSTVIGSNLSSAQGYYFAKTNATSTGPDTVYVADGNKIKKFVYDINTDTWGLSSTLNSSGQVMGLTGYQDGSTIRLYFSFTNSNNNSFATVTDAGSFSSANVTTLASAGTNRIFRGTAFAPAQLSWDVSKTSGTWDTTNSSGGGSSNWIQDGKGTATKYHAAYAAYLGNTSADITITVQSGGVTPANIFATNETNTYTINGDIMGIAGIFKSGAGTLKLDGNNSFGGGVVVNGGTLLGQARSTAGETPFGKGSFTLNGGELRLDGISNTSSSTVYADTSLIVAGGSTFTIRNQDTSSITTFRIDNVERSGRGTLVYQPFSGSPIGNEGTSGERFVVDQDLQGSKPIVNPWVVIRRSNTNPAADFASFETNGIIATSSYKSINSSGANDVGIVSSATTLSASRNVYAIKVDANLNLGGNTLTLGNGTHSSFAGLILNNSGTTISNGTLAASSRELLIYTSSSASISAVITGSGGLTVFGPGTLTLSGNNSFSGTAALNQGTLSISSNTHLGNTGNGLQFNGGTLINTSSTDVTSARAVTVNAAGGTMEVTNSTTNWTISGAWKGSGDFTKSGSGRLTLSGNLTAFGGNTVRVNAGTLALTGSDANTTLKNAYNINIASNATLDVSGVNPTSYAVGNGQLLQGQGTVALGTKRLTVGTGATIGGGIDSTGASTVGTLTITETAGGSGTQFQNGGSWLVKFKNLADDTSGSNAGTNYDKISFGTLDLSNLGTNDKFTLVLKSLTSSNLPGNATNDLSSGDSRKYVIGTYTTLNGTFDASKFNVDVSGFTNYQTGYTWTLDVTGGNVVLTYSAVPEPSSILLICAGTLGLGGFIRRRWNRTCDAQHSPTLGA